MSNLLIVNGCVAFENVDIYYYLTHKQNFICKATQKLVEVACDLATNRLSTSKQTLTEYRILVL